MRENLNSFIWKGWVLEKLEDFSILEGFDCGDAEINDYYRNLAYAHYAAGITETYCFYPIGDGCSQEDSAAFADLCCSSINLKVWPEERKQEAGLDRFAYASFPSMKLTRLGVDREFHGLGVGTHLLDAVKNYLVQNHLFGCRFLQVDAYNTEKTLRFYCEKNQFQRVPLSKNIRLEERPTVPLMFDLALLRRVPSDGGTGIF